MSQKVSVAERIAARKAVEAERMAREKSDQEEAAQHVAENFAAVKAERLALERAQQQARRDTEEAAEALRAADRVTRMIAEESAYSSITEDTDSAADSTVDSVAEEHRHSVKESDSQSEAAKEEESQDECSSSSETVSADQSLMSVAIGNLVEQEAAQEEEEEEAETEGEGETEQGETELVSCHLCGVQQRLSAKYCRKCGSPNVANPGVSADDLQFAAKIAISNKLAAAPKFGSARRRTSSAAPAGDDDSAAPVVAAASPGLADGLVDGVVVDDGVEDASTSGPTGGVAVEEDASSVAAAVAGEQDSSALLHLKRKQVVPECAPPTLHASLVDSAEREQQHVSPADEKKVSPDKEATRGAEARSSSARKTKMRGSRNSRPRGKEARAVAVPDVISNTDVVAAIELVPPPHGSTMEDAESVARAFDVSPRRKQAEKARRMDVLSSLPGVMDLTESQRASLKSAAEEEKEEKEGEDGKGTPTGGGSSSGGRSRMALDLSVPQTRERLPTRMRNTLHEILSPRRKTVNISDSKYAESEEFSSPPTTPTTTAASAAASLKGLISSALNQGDRGSNREPSISSPVPEVVVRKPPSARGSLSNQISGRFYGTESLAHAWSLEKHAATECSGPAVPVTRLDAPLVLEGGGSPAPAGGHYQEAHADLKLNDEEREDLMRKTAADNYSSLATLWEDKDSGAAGGGAEKHHSGKRTENLKNSAKKLLSAGKKRLASTVAKTRHILSHEAPEAELPAELPQQFALTSHYIDYSAIPPHYVGVSQLFSKWDESPPKLLIESKHWWVERCFPFADVSTCTKDMNCYLVCPRESVLTLDVSHPQVVHYIARDHLLGPCILSLCEGAAAFWCFRGGFDVLMDEEEASKLQSSKNPQKLLRKILMREFYASATFEKQHVLFPSTMEHFQADCRGTDVKVGLVYCAPGQSLGDDILQNTKTSSGWRKFLGELGSKVTLKGWPKFAAGLDVENYSTGKHSLYTEFNFEQRCTFNIMFHVAPWMTSDDPQTATALRNKHFADDLVIIIYLEDSTNKIDPALFKGAMNHTVIAVAHNPDDLLFTVSCSQKRGMPEAIPPILPSKSVSLKQLRGLVLSKAINSQRIALKQPVFKEERELTRTVMLEEMATRNHLKPRALHADEK